jgi:hypothetical protein
VDPKIPNSTPGKQLSQENPENSETSTGSPAEHAKKSMPPIEPEATQSQNSDGASTSGAKNSELKAGEALGQENSENGEAVASPPVEQAKKLAPSVNPEKIEQIQNPELGSLTDLEARVFYLNGEKSIAARNQELISQGVSARDRAIELIQARNDLRTRTRELMADRERAKALDITDPNRTLDELVKRAYRESGLVGDALWDYLADSASRSRKSVNERFGL